MTTKTKLEPLNIGVRDNQLLVDKNGDKFVDLLSDLGWDADKNPKVDFNLIQNQDRIYKYK